MILIMIEMTRGKFVLLVLIACFVTLWCKSWWHGKLNFIQNVVMFVHNYCCAPKTQTLLIYSVFYEDSIWPGGGFRKKLSLCAHKIWAIRGARLERAYKFTSALTLSEGLVSGVTTLPPSRVLWVSRHFLVTKVWIFLSPFGPKAHLCAKSRQESVTETALYIYKLICWKAGVFG